MMLVVMFNGSNSIIYIKIELINIFIYTYSFFELWEGCDRTFRERCDRTLWERCDRTLWGRCDGDVVLWVVLQRSHNVRFGPNIDAGWMLIFVDLISILQFLALPYLC